MVTCALIPARGGSKGLPGKNLAHIGGRTLLERAIDVGQGTTRIDEVVVSSDDQTILDVATRAGVVAAPRPPALATDEAHTLDVVRHFLRSRPDVDIIVLLQPTSPLRAVEDVDRCLDALGTADSVATVTETEHPIEWTFNLDSAGRLQPLLGWDSLASRRQEAAATHRLNGAVYVARAASLRDGHQLVGPGTIGIPMPRRRSVDVDDEMDLGLARLLHGQARPSDSMP